MNNRILEITRQLKNPPKLPPEMVSLLELIDNPETTAPILARFINSDLILTTKILNLANSSFYRFPQRIRTINHAIVVLGFQSVRDLGLLISAYKALTDGEYQNYFDPTQFWLHSIATSAGCKIIAEKSNFKIPGEVLVTGFLHDIGILILCDSFGDRYKDILKTSSDEKISLYEAEMRVLGFSHADVGGYILEKWNISSYHSSAIYDYPHPWKSTDLPNTAMLVNFSDILARRMGLRIVESDMFPEIHPKVISYLNLRLMGSGDIDWDYYRGLLSDEMNNARAFLSVLRANN